MRNAAAAGLSDNLEDGTYDDDVAASGEQSNGSEYATILQMARQCLSDSVNYLDTAHRSQIERNIANYQSRHPAGSKFYSPAYKHRAKQFIPKTKAASMRRDAAISFAFFSTSNATSITPVNKASREQAAAAALHHKLLEERLSRTGTVKWYEKVIGASQDAFVQGVCISCQYWDYREDEDGEIIKDTPMIRLIPIENFRFSPGADWADVVNDSPYLIEDMPMYARDVRMKMLSGEWLDLGDSTIMTASITQDSTKSAREHGEASSQEADTFEPNRMVMTRRMIVRDGHTDFVFYMLGDTHLLTAPTRLKDISPNGKPWRNYVVGTMSIESHKSIPQAPAEMLASLQANLNDIVNSRQDNVSLAIHKRFFVRRKGRVDLPALLRNVPGGSVMVNEHNDVREMDVRDVTASSYKEQEVMNASFDEIGGGFNPSSVVTNRAMNETVGGMELMASDSNTMTEHGVKQFAVTWAAPVLQQLLELQKAFETDFDAILGAADAANIEGMGVTEFNPEQLLQLPVKLQVNIGIDSTNPGRAVDRLMSGVSIGAQLGVPFDGAEIYKEVMGKLGYDDGSRFVQEQDPNAQPPGPTPEEQAAEAAAQAEAGKQQLAQAKLQQDGQIQMQKLQLDMQRLQMQLEAQIQMKQMDVASRVQTVDTQTETQANIALMQDRTNREQAQLAADTTIQSKLIDGQVATDGQRLTREMERERAVERANAVESKSRNNAPPSGGQE